MKQLSLLLACLCMALCHGAHVAEWPDIVFILADDQAPWALRASGYPYAYTPNLDRVARESMGFTRAFTPTPVCSPLRASWLTSRYGSQLSIIDWIHPNSPATVAIRSKLTAQILERTEVLGDTALVSARVAV